MRSASFLSLLVVAGCSGGPPAPADAGIDAGETDGGSQPVDAGPLCASDEACDNGLFCDGVGRCLPGDPAADPRGCVVTQPCQPGEICEEALALCRPDTCEDQDDDSYTTCEGDCDDTRNDVNPGRNESCTPGDPTDEDCNPRTFGFLDVDGDGEADAECYNVDRATGMRYAGTDCNDTIRTINSSAVEICDGTVDHDCDGVIDQEEPNCPCIPDGGTRPCGSSSTGICRLGLSTCTSAGWSDCVGNIEPMPMELCNGGPDDDCDGTADEGCTCTSGNMQPCGVGACVGMRTCTAGTWGPCNGASPTTERCDGIDSDCDGTDDASDEDVVGAGDTCGNNVGICRSGTQSCAGSMLVCGGPGYVPPGSETCNHVDDDCDNLVDDGVAAATCMRTAGAGLNDFDCYEYGSGGCGTSRNLGAGTSDGNTPPRVLIARGFRGDFGARAYYRATFTARERQVGTAEGNFSLFLSPTAGVSGEFFPTLDGVPYPPAGQYAVAVNLLERAVQIAVFDSRGPRPIGMGATLPSACAVNATSATFTIEVTLDNGSVSATVTRDMCGSVTVTGNLPNYLVDWYGEESNFPRYYLGVAGDNDDSLLIQLNSLYMERRSTAGQRNNCIGCL